MIQITTSILVLVCFLSTVIFTERYFKTHEIISLRKLILGSLAVLFTLLTIVVIFPPLFPILIYGSVILASFICVSSRHHSIARKGMY